MNHIELCKKNINDAYVWLVSESVYHSKLYNLTKKVITTEVPTLSIAITETGPVMKINPYLFNWLGKVEERASLLIHELEHILRRHTEREKTLEPELFKEEQTIQEMIKSRSKSYLLNVAEDRTINEHLKHLPTTMAYFDEKGNILLDENGKEVLGELVTKESFNKRFPDVRVRDFEAMEYYYGILTSNKNFNDGEIPLVPVDFHEQGTLDLQIEKEIAKQIINEAYENLSDKDVGKVPGYVKVLIENINKSNKDWTDDLLFFGQNCALRTKKFSRSKRNKRYGWDEPGRKYRKLLHLVTVIDSSASVRNLELSAFVSELHNLRELGIQITLIVCDEEIKEVIRFDSDTEVSIVGKGGTSFAPPFEMIQTEEFISEYGEPDGLIYFTDGGDWYSLEEEPSIPVLWALLPNCKVSYSWGQVTHITVPEAK